jgi:hypothetical protein
VLRATLVLTVLRAKQALLVLPVLQAQQALLARPGSKVIQGSEAILGQEHKDKLVSRVIPALRAIQVPKVILASVFRARQASLGLRVLLEDQLVLLVSKV